MKNKDICHCEYDKEGRMFGLCLRCFKMQLKARQDERKRIAKEVRKLKRVYDKGLPFYTTNPEIENYNWAIEVVLDLLKK